MVAEIVEVVRDAAAVFGHGVFPINVDAVKVVLEEESDNRLEEGVLADCGAGHVGKGGAVQLRVVHGPSANGLSTY